MSDEVSLIAEDTRDANIIAVGQFLSAKYKMSIALYLHFQKSIAA